MTPAFVALGSNAGDRLANLRAATAALAGSDGLRFVRCSSVYETAPVGPPQRDFLNAVVELESGADARSLLERMQSIERELGRVERERWGPREIDLDLLLFGEAVIDEPGLAVPHPRMAERAFVLVPLADVAPFATVPGAGIVAALVDAVGTQGVRRAHAPREIWPD